MPLNELRQTRGLSQKMLAEVLHVQQPSIAKLEKQTDITSSRCTAISRQWAATLRWLRVFRMVCGQNQYFRVSHSHATHGNEKHENVQVVLNRLLIK
jgi:DNA-binding XRE family transcriptional regulator